MARNLTFLNYAYRVLAETKKAMTPEEIWFSPVGEKLKVQLDTKGKTPLLSLGARLYTDVKNENSKLEAVGSRPTKFKVKGLSVTAEAVDEIVEESVNEKQAKRISYLEKDLHPLLVWFARREFSAWCSTISHSKSIKQSEKQNQWLHPDIVGFTLLSQSWNRPVASLMKSTGASAVKMYSFELKRQIDFANLREYFFQAVSNSSWANAGYLVVAELTETPEFLEELARLSQSFGIGVIRLSLANLEDSEILYPAKEKTELDWDTVNRLAKLNSDYDEFLNLVGESISLNKIVSETHFDKADKSDSIIGQAAKLLKGQKTISPLLDAIGNE